MIIKAVIGNYLEIIFFSYSSFFSAFTGGQFDIVIAYLYSHKQ